MYYKINTGKHYSTQIAEEILFGAQVCLWQIRDPVIK